MAPVYQPKKKLSIKNSADVRITNQGIAYADLNNSRDVSGIIPSFTNSNIPDIDVLPVGVLVYNTDEQALQLSTASGWVSTGSVGSGISTSGLDLSGNLSVSGSFVLSSGTTIPESSASPGTVGEFRWDANFLYIKTPDGWLRTSLGAF